MPFNTLGFKSMVNDKAQALNKDRPLSQGRTKMASRMFAKIKQKINRQCNKTAGVLHRRADTKAADANSTAADFTIPPLEFSQEDLSVITEGALETTRHPVAQTTPVCADVPEPCTLVHEPTATGIASPLPSCASASSESIPTSKGALADSSTDSASSPETDLTVYSAATATKSEDQLVSEQVAEPAELAGPPRTDTPIYSDSVSISTTPATVMVEKQKKVLRHKMIEALNKLKIPFWPWKAAIPKTTAEPVVEENYADRCQWDVIEKIEHETILQVLRSALVKKNKGYEVQPMKIVKTAQGSYHQVYIAKTFNPRSHKMEGWVVKVPGHGTPDRWTAEDEYMLKQEYETTRLIVTYTEVPAPFPIDYSATLKNKYGFPYMVMKELPGKNACELWYDDWCTTPSPETEQKRENMLRSLAAHMTELNKLNFDHIGMPVFDPTHEDFVNYDDIELERLPVDKYHVWPFCDSYRSIERGPFPSTQAFVQNGMNESNEIEGLELPQEPVLDEDLSKMTGNDQKALSVSKFFEIVASHPVFQSTAADTFALRHSDLDLQNIFIDDDGNVTGILDWDGSLAMPRCVAHAAAPHFLELDWYGKASLHTPFLPWRAGHYRNIYAAALLDAANPDVKFTSKSHMYQAVFAALYEGTNKQDVMSRLLKEIPGFQLDEWEVTYLLAKGCKMTEDMLKKELGKILNPEMPPEYFRGEIEKQQKNAALQRWVDEFEGFSSVDSDDDLDRFSSVDNDATDGDGM
jgi:hypothetical protein